MLIQCAGLISPPTPPLALRVPSCCQPDTAQEQWGTKGGLFYLTVCLPPARLPSWPVWFVLSNNSKETPASNCHFLKNSRKTRNKRPFWEKNNNLKFGFYPHFFYVWVNNYRYKLIYLIRYELQTTQIYCIFAHITYTFWIIYDEKVY